MNVKKSASKPINVVVKKGRLLARFEKIRFLAVGALNTLLDFAILNILVGVFGINLVPANIASTSVSIIASYTLNKKAVFPTGKKASVKQFVAFVVVTLIGTWVIQNLIMVNVYAWLESLLHVHKDSGWLSWVLLNAAKVAATLFSAIWNYIWYSRVVFKKANSHEGTR